MSVLHNDGDGTFITHATYGVGYGPRSVVAGDLDTDGNPDLVVANAGHDNISVLRNDGDGTFAAHMVYSAGDRPHSVTTGDLDSDGDLDLAIANYNSGNVSVLLNNGDSTFTDDGIYSPDYRPMSVEVGDLDGDSDLDLIVAHYGGDVSVLRNDGDGAFATHLAYNVGDVAASVVAGDLDGDGDLDLAVVNFYSNTISVLCNDGEGAFAAQVTYGVGDRPQSVVMGDLDGDGDLDLTVANTNSDNVSVLLNDSSGAFAAHETYSVGNHPQSVAMGDLDGDADLDLIIANGGDNNISVLRNDGDGAFTAQATYGVGRNPNSVAIGDLDGDGDQDLVITNPGHQNVSMLRNDGDGTFGTHVTYSVGNGPYSVAVGDLDEDGDLDLAVTNTNSGNVSVLCNQGEPSSPTWLDVSDTTLSFSALEGGPFPALQSVRISNGGGGQLNWSASKSASWLSISPVSSAAPATLTASVDTTGLTVGTYVDTIIIDGGSEVQNSPQHVTVELRVLPNASTLYTIGNQDGDGDYLIEWSLVSGALTYTLQEDDNALFISPISRYVGANSQHFVSGQALGTWYYRVRAAGISGPGPWSNTQFAVCRVVVYLPLVIRHWPPIPNVPTLYTINNTDGGGNYTVNWSVSPLATSYALQEAKNSAFSGAVEVYNGASTSHAVSGRGATRYYYRVKGRNTWGDSGWSNVQSVDVLWEAEPNEDAWTQANGPILSGLTYYGTFPSPADEKDYFYFDLSTPRSVELWLTDIPSGYDYDLVLRDANLEIRGLSDNKGNTSEHIQTGVLPAGRYYVQAYNYGGTGSSQPYHLRVVYE